jgi:hypothetical protein
MRLIMGYKSGVQFQSVAGIFVDAAMRIPAMNSTELLSNG